jgi:hypothetical protein
MESLEETELNFTSRPVTDVDVGIVQERLQRLGLKRISKDVAHQAVDVRAHERRFHPVRDYLSELEWDGTARIDSFFPNYLGSEDSDYARRIGAMFLIAMVARIFAPGLQGRLPADHRRAARRAEVERVSGARRPVVLRQFAGH